MSLHKLVFDKSFAYKYYRHILFWLAWFIFLTAQMLLYLKNVGVPVSQYPTVFMVKSWVLLLNMIYCYVVVYVLMPKYLSKGKPLLLVAIAVLFALAVDSFKTIVIFWNFGNFKEQGQILFLDVLNEVRNFIRTGPVPVCCLFAACKMLKSYYLKLEEKKVLIKENADAELQLLKAQVHPHFLFNTLNNIYSLILHKSPQAPAIITKLRDTIRYMISDCGSALVPLEKELQMITDYTSLEKIRYGGRLQIDVAITGETKNKMIAPLLLIPFIENSFKHGTSQMLQHAWIKLKIDIKEEQLFFSIANSKPVGQKAETEKSGMGLKNVRKRLALLYPLQHRLTTNSDLNFFSVIMNLPLHEETHALIPIHTGEQSLLTSHKALTYA